LRENGGRRSDVACLEDAEPALGVLWLTPASSRVATDSRACPFWQGEPQKILEGQEIAMPSICLTSRFDIGGDVRAEPVIVGFTPIERRG